MDSAVAALIGASIGALASLLGSVVFPAIMTAITRSKDAADALRLEQRAEIDAFTRAGTDVLAKWARTGERADIDVLMAGIAFTTAGQRLALVIPAAQEDVNKVVAFTVKAGDDVGVREAMARLDTCTSVLVDWYRGALPYREVRPRFDELLAANRVITGADQ